MLSKLSVHAATPSRRLLKFCAHCCVKMGEYFCNICEFHGDDISKGQFHYDDCGIGRSLSLSNVYCESTGSRYSISAHNDRVCIENSMKNYCPVCYEVCGSTAICHN